MIPGNYLMLLFLTFQTIILFDVIKTAFSFHIIYKATRIYYLVLIIYQLTVILKFISFSPLNAASVASFYVTSAFEILIGLFFVFINETNSKLIFRSRSLNSLN